MSYFNKLSSPFIVAKIGQDHSDLEGFGEPVYSIESPEPIFFINDNGVFEYNEAIKDIKEIEFDG